MPDRISQDIELCIHVNRVRNQNRRSTYLRQGYLYVYLIHVFSIRKLHALIPTIVDITMTQKKFQQHLFGSFENAVGDSNPNSQCDDDA